MARCRPHHLFVAAVLAGCATLSLAQPTSPGIEVPGAGPRPGAAVPRPAPAPAQRSSNSTVPLDRVIAVVNDEALTQYELEEMKRIVLQQMKASNVRPPPPDALETRCSERLIVDRALQQFAKENGVRVDDQMVERTILRIAQERNKLTPEELRRALEREKIPYPNTAKTSGAKSRFSGCANAKSTAVCRCPRPK
jgi:peptidyl-prolyl cis-trans isomerase SurA